MAIPNELNLDAMDADQLRSFAKANGLKYNPLPNVKAETLRDMIAAQLQEDKAYALPTSGASDAASALQATQRPQTPQVCLARLWQPLIRKLMKPLSPQPTMTPMPPPSHKLKPPPMHSSPKPIQVSCQ